MSRFLYGAAVQGIQGYIFQTNKLKDIMGASDLVAKICDELFLQKFAGSAQMIVHAAGNVKCIYGNEEECKRAVRWFPKAAMEMAPGITISQAVVKMDDGMNFADAIDELERRLHAQRNVPCKSLIRGDMAMERSRKTGLPAVNVAKNGDFQDESTVKKDEAADALLHESMLYKKLFGRNVSAREIGFDTKDLTGGNDWIAVIHADGNGLGEVVASIGKDEGRLCSFSEKLDLATSCAAQKAYGSAVTDKGNFQKLPMRPIVIGGDDLTVICRADLAIDFVKEYLKEFENESKEKTGYQLTACAGIAFVKSSYPFYYAYDLAETMCGRAKADAKSEDMKNANGGKAPSCLMFYKVQSSFVEDFDTIKRKELTPTDGHSFCFGPYYIAEQEDRWTVDKLTQHSEHMAEEANNPIKTAVRKWLSLMHYNVDAAKQHSERVCALHSESQNNLYKESVAEAHRNGEACYPAYDVLSLHTVIYQKTK